MASQSGHIVLVASIASFTPHPSAPAYHASKMAVRGYGEGMVAKKKK
jgi:short-subunit dehydrogenase